MNEFDLPLFIRGQIIEDDWCDYSLRHNGKSFRAPNLHRYIKNLPLSNPKALKDLQDINFGEILDVLEELGKNLDFDKNPYIRQAYKASLVAAPYPPAMLKNSYLMLPSAFNRDSIEEIAEKRIGIDYLDGWVSQELLDGRILNVRAFGARSLHIPAGNGGLVSAITLIRNAITRSDAIIKAPSNDPMTAMALARTLAEIAPNHPLTNHLSVAYWKGGDENIEQQLFRPEHIEKIVAWGGFSSVKHITQFIQPGLEMIALDPKRSATIIGPEAFLDQTTMKEVAKRAACDIAMANQEACASARIIYVLCGTDVDAIENLNFFGKLIYEAMLSMPSELTSKPVNFDRELRDQMEATRLDDTFYRIIGGEDNEGAIIVSQFDEPVDYSALLSGRVANLVPIDDIKKVTDAVNAYTQTVGIYPENLKKQLRDELPIYGAQRLTSLGYACNVTSASPQDAIEPVRRMCKWVFEEECDPKKVHPLWSS
ncbi:MAG: acyl-CoA reductase [Pseudomonadota bacterium]|nr:acyl-CoA reductase [Pseudomonadota bacterium]